MTRQEIDKKTEEYRQQLLDDNGPQLLETDRVEIVIDYLDRRDHRIHEVKYIAQSIWYFGKAFQDFLERVNRLKLDGYIIPTGADISKVDENGRDIDCHFVRVLEDYVPIPVYQEELNEERKGFNPSDDRKMKEGN